MDAPSAVPLPLAQAWEELSSEEKETLLRADTVVAKTALRTAAVVAHTLRVDDISSRPVCARKAEKDVLEHAARELHLLVMHTGTMPHAMDGQIPLAIETGTGLIGIEVKSGSQTIATDEVDKFRVDLALGPFVVGIFISLRAPIAKIPRGVHVQHELSIAGAIPSIFVSPLSADSTIQCLTRNSLTLASLLASRNSKLCEEASMQEIGRTVSLEVAALGITRKRLRDEEEQFQKRVDRTTDAIMGVQHRLSSAVAGLLRLPKTNSPPLL